MDPKKKNKILWTDGDEITPDIDPDYERDGWDDFEDAMNDEYMFGGD